MEIVRIPCPFCKTTTEVELTEDEKKQLNRLFNEPVQNVFPNWKPEKRELFISGICLSCQKQWLNSET